jgi:phosphonate transport system substrate-binding protein
LELRLTGCRVIITLVLMIMLTSVARAVEVPRRLIFAVVPSLVPEKLVSTFEPLVDFLSSRIDLAMRIETAPDYREFTRRTHEEQRYDFVLSSPHLAYLANNVANYDPLVRADAEPLRAVVVVRMTSDLRVAADLAKRKLAIPDELSIVTVLTRATLAREHIGFRRNVDVVLTPTVDAAFQLLLHGRVDAAAVSSSFLRAQLLPNVRDQIRVIIESDEVPQMTISVAPWVSQALRDQVRRVLLTMHESVQGGIVLRKMSFNGFVPAESKDYVSMRHVMRYLEY